VYGLLYSVTEEVGIDEEEFDVCLDDDADAAEALCRADSSARAFKASAPGNGYSRIDLSNHLTA
jgi:hypothetical protein